MRGTFVAALFVGLMMCVSCTDYTPKPRGYVRIEPPRAGYKPLAVDNMPCAFLVSQLVTVEQPKAEGSERWVNLSYPSLGAKIYCSYLPVTLATLPGVMNESRMMVGRLMKQENDVKERAYENPSEGVYGSLFLLSGDVASPVQFVLTDSARHFFRGALYYDCVPNADSLAPLTDYFRADIIELIQSFTWKKENNASSL